MLRYEREEAMRVLGLCDGECERDFGVVEVGGCSLEVLGVRVVEWAVEAGERVAGKGTGEVCGLRLLSVAAVGTEGSGGPLRGCSVALLALTRILFKISSRRGRRTLGSQGGFAGSIR